jgi:hypothetical protein
LSDELLGNFLQQAIAVDLPLKKKMNVRVNIAPTLAMQLLYEFIHKIADTRAKLEQTICAPRSDTAVNWLAET